MKLYLCVHSVLSKHIVEGIKIDVVSNITKSVDTIQWCPIIYICIYNVVPAGRIG